VFCVEAAANRLGHSFLFIMSGQSWVETGQSIYLCVCVCVCGGGGGGEDKELPPNIL
jgi:hypothetical protein